MRNLLLLLALTILFGCEKSKEELMVKDFVKENLLKANIDIEDTDFEMVSVKQIETIKAKDSLPYHVSKLKSAKSDMLDINFKLLSTYTRMKDTVNVEKTKMSIAAIENDNFENMPELMALHIKLQNYDKDKVVSTVYEATYKISSLGQKRTFTKKYYSNKDNTKIVRAD